MLQYHKLGEVPSKPHTTFYEDGKLMMEHCVTREGFEGAFSIMYYRIPPTRESAIEPLSLPGFCPHEVVGTQDLRRRHVPTKKLAAGGDFLTSRKTLFVNSDVQVGICKPTEAPDPFFSNADGDELYFMNSGSGYVESLYGILPFREHDYVLIPKSTPYRIHFEGGAGTALVFEGKPKLGIPSQYRTKMGQLSMYAPYTHRDFRLPERLLAFDEKLHGKGPYRLVVKAFDELSVHFHDHFPFDIIGWDGVICPFAFNIHDFQPKTGLVHLPPTIHTTFSGSSFVVCSFVPRMTDFHENAIPCPYGHSSVDMDEIMFYVSGNFSSRKGVSPESMSLHPWGVPHGAHPGAYKGSIGSKRTEELAVMCDCYKPFKMTTVAADVEDLKYHFSWVK